MTPMRRDILDIPEFITSGSQPVATSRQRGTEHRCFVLGQRSADFSGVGIPDFGFATVAARCQPAVIGG